MKKFLVIIAFLVLSAVILSACGQSTADWREYTNEEGKFSVLLPGEPKEETSSIETDTGTIQIHLFGVPIGDTDYIVAYTDYPAELINTKGAQGILDSARDGAVENTKGKLLSDETIDLNGNPGKLLVVESPDGKGIAQAKIFLVGTRLYQVFVAAAKEKANTEENQNYLNSLRINP